MTLQHIYLKWTSTIHGIHFSKLHPILNDPNKKRELKLPKNVAFARILHKLKFANKMFNSYIPYTRCTKLWHHFISLNMYKAELSLNATVEAISVENCVISRNLAHAKNNADGLLPSYPSVSLHQNMWHRNFHVYFTYCVYIIPSKAPLKPYNNTQTKCLVCITFLVVTRLGVIIVRGGILNGSYISKLLQNIYKKKWGLPCQFLIPRECYVPRTICMCGINGN